MNVLNLFLTKIIMLENIIKILKSNIKEYKKEALAVFKDFVKAELWLNKVTYDDIEKYVFNIDWPDPSFDIWMIRWLEMFLNKLDNHYTNTVYFTLEVLEEYVIDIFWLDEISELKTLTSIFDYNDIIWNYNDLISKLWLWFVIINMNTWGNTLWLQYYSLWTKAMVQLWNKYIELDDFDLEYTSIQKLYLVLNELENKCKQLSLLIP